MAGAKILVGLEIGTSKVCAIVGEARGNNALKILGVGQTRSEGVSKGEIVDFEAAQNCIHEALVKAEDLSNVMIRSVFLNISGAHIKSLNNRGRVIIPEDKEEVDESCVREAKEIAQNVDIPEENVYIHSITRQYILDGQERISNPLGMLGRKLEVDYHVIYGMRSRIHNAIRCARETPLEVEDVVFAPVAAAQIILNKQAKNDGALVIDFGGGTMDYVVYDQGSIASSGCIPIGGTHITNDLSQVLRISKAEAEKIKRAIGCGKVDSKTETDYVSISDDRKTSKALIYQIINARVEETLNILKKRLDAEDKTLISRLSSGVFLCGGVSKMRGFQDFVSRFFNLRKADEAQRGTRSFSASSVDNPQFVTPIGLLRYGQIIEQKRPQSSMIKRFSESIGDFFGTSNS